MVVGGGGGPAAAAWGGGASCWTGDGWGGASERGAGVGEVAEIMISESQ